MTSSTKFRAISALFLLLFGVWVLAPPPPSFATGVSRFATSQPPVSATTSADDAAIWTWPAHPIPDVTRPFDLPHPYGAGHRGIDLEMAPGSEVLAPDDGVVHFAGWVVDRPVLSILHPNGLISSFEPVIAIVSKGDAVSRGEVIGHLSTEQVHVPSGGLHLGARDGETYIDPLALLGAVPRAILLPHTVP